VGDEAIYLLMSVRNVVNGLAVLDRWDLMADRVRDERSAGEEESFQRLSRDIYVPAGDLGFWQGTLRDLEDPHFDEVRRAIEEPRAMTLDILYRDHDGGQRTVSRFSLLPVSDGQWLATVARHWNLDRPNVDDRDAVARIYPDCVGQMSLIRAGRPPRGTTLYWPGLRRHGSLEYLTTDEFEALRSDHSVGRTLMTVGKRGSGQLAVEL
jgi:hypothetical protein